MQAALHPTVPTGLTLALFKGTRPGVSGLYNRVGRYLDCGSYSHCELIFPHGISASSSFMDGGVRMKIIGYSSAGNWDFMPIPDPHGKREAAAWDWFCRHNGLAYDVLGNLRFATNFARDSADKWFCSEACMAALGFPEAYRYGPSGAASLAQWHFGAELKEVFANG